MAAAKSNKKKPRRKHPKKPRRHHRRNPKHSFMDSLGKLALGAGVALGTGVLVTLGTSKIAPGQWYSLYGIPAVTFLGGAAIATKAPTIGVGMALGSFTPFAIPLASRMLQPAPQTTASGLSRAMRAVQLGDGYDEMGMGAVDMSAVDLGAYEYAD